MVKKQYIEDEAEASGTEGSSGSEDLDEYEKDSFLATSDEENNAASPVPNTTQKKTKRRKGPSSDSENDESQSKPKKSKTEKALTTTEPKKGVVVSNKKLDPASFPAKPVVTTASSTSDHITLSHATQKMRPYFFRMTFTHGSLLTKFLEPVAKSVKKIRFSLCKTPEFTGFKMEAHDAYLTLANQSRFECDIEVGQGIHGDTMTPQEINKYIFTVRSKSFMDALNASALKETTLSIARYHDTSDNITFESINNENDVRTIYTCATVENSEVESLDSIKINLGFHVNVYMGMLKELCLSAKRCGALTLKFDLYQAKDPKEPDVMHSKMCIGFSGDETTGSHDFYLSTRKTVKNIDGRTINVWDPLPGLSMATQNGLVLEKKCSQEYENSKLRMFLNHMECKWVLVHLGNENKPDQPLVLECTIGGKNTKHTIIVAPKMDASN